VITGASVIAEKISLGELLMEIEYDLFTLAHTFSNNGDQISFESE